MAFDNLTAKLQNVFKGLRSKGRLTEADVKAALREVKMALLEADVNFKVVKQFVKAVQERATGEDVYKRQDFGEPPLVTPSSQIVGTQAVLNVVSGERYKMVTKESKKLLSGEFGQTVKPFNPEVQKKCIGDTKPITCRPADLIEPQLKKLEAEMSQWKEQDEDVLSYALFPQVAVDFFKYREAQRTKVDATLADKENQTYPV